MKSTTNALAIYKTCSILFAPVNYSVLSIVFSLALNPSALKYIDLITYNFIEENYVP